MNDTPGFNPLHWDCKVTGCFNYHRHFDIEHFAQCFPRKIGFTDLDAFVELGGYFLIVEFKDRTADLKDGQRIAFERLTAISDKITVVAVRCNYRSSEVYGIKVVKAGKSSGWKDADLDKFTGFVQGWADRVQNRPIPISGTAA